MAVILQVLPSLVTGGVERSTVEMTQAIAGAGWTALVASSGGPLVAAIERAGGRHITLPLETKNPFTLLRNARGLADLTRTGQVDLVHARSRAPAWSAWIAARRAGRHFVTTYHGAYGEDLPFKRRYNSVMAKGEVVIVASRFMADLVMQRHRVDRRRIKVIPRGVDPTLFDPASVQPDRIARLAAAWNLPPGAPVILLPGRITGWKGQSVLLDAMSRLSRRDLVAVLAGADQGRTHVTARLRQQAEALGIAGRVRLPGDCADMPAALALADIVVHASTEPEAFGRVVIEAQAMERPVIASNLGGPVETIDDGVTGWLVPPGDPAALAAALEKVLAMQPSQRAKIGEAARAAVLARCTTHAMQQATLEVYREVLSPGVSTGGRT